MVVDEPDAVTNDEPRTVPAWSVAAWPLRWKVAAILILPVVLAMTLGALRVQSELRDASRLSIAADDSDIVSPAVEFIGRTNDLAVAAATRTDVASATARFDEIATRFGELIRSGEFETSVAADFATATTTADSLRKLVSAGAAPVSQLAQLSDDVTASTSAALTSTMRSIDDDGVRTLADSLAVALSAQRSLTTQEVLVESTDFGDDVAVRVQVAAAAGTETAALDELARLGSTSVDVSALLSAVQNRRDAYSRPGAAAVEASQFTTSAESSAEQYGQLTSGLGTELSETVQGRANDLRSAALRDAAIVLGAVLVALALALAVGRSLIRSISTLRHGALQVARLRLPEEIERLGSSGGVPVITAVPVHTKEEIGQLARAVDDIHYQALRLASERGQHLQIGDMFETLSRRSRSLVEEQLSLIETLERDEQDPQRLEHLFRLDHLTTRMRRNGDNLLVLADTTERSGRLDPVPVGDVLRAAMSEVEEYRRVEIGPGTDAALTGSAAADISHLLAELIDNALRFSPPDTNVALTVSRAVDGGILVEVVDGGLGMPEADLRAANDRLSMGGEVTPETARRMGLFVVGRLARRHDATVRIRSTSGQHGQSGVTVSVHLPGALIAAPRAVDRTNGQNAGTPVRSSAIESADFFGARRVADNTERKPDDAVFAGRISTPVEPASDPTYSPGLPRRSPGASGVSAESMLRPIGVTPTPAPATTSDTGRPIQSETYDFFSPRPAIDSSDGQPAGDPVWPTVEFPVPDPAPPAVSLDAEPMAAADAPPIFQRLTSEWLLETTPGDSGERNWSTPADTGWSAAQHASESRIDRYTESGLPLRERGARLVPGHARWNASTGGGTIRNVRDPAEVRALLEEQFAGVRQGRTRTEEGRHSREGDR